MKRGLLSAAAWLAVSVAAAAPSENVCVEVATLNGAPVYHWRVFKGTVVDDVDRALILREFQRKRFKLPPKLVDDGVQRAVLESAGGDAEKFADHLKSEGASMKDFRLFIAEEITINAMLFQKGSAADRQRKQREWLAGLRTNASIVRTSSVEKSSH